MIRLTLRFSCGGRLRRRNVLGALVLAASVGCQDPSATSIERGDRLLAVGDVDAAIAEYRLARRQTGDQPGTLLRLGHAYASRGDVDQALGVLEPLAEARPDLQPQIAAELLELARAAGERGARENMVRALRPVLGWGLGYVPHEMRVELAAHFDREGDSSRALGFYLAALGDSETPDPRLLYGAGRAYEELGSCERARVYFEGYLSGTDRQAPDRDAARWHLGNCLFVTADEDRAAGRPSAALEKLDRMVQLGVPRTLIDDAHFLRGEMLLSLGQAESALGAYRRVLDLNPSRTGSLVRRAEDRIRQIRFGFDE